MVSVSPAYHEFLIACTDETLLAHVSSSAALLSLYAESAPWVPRAVLPQSLSIGRRTRSVHLQDALRVGNLMTGACPT